MDRNFVPFDVIRPAIESLSARRAWIEIEEQQEQESTTESLSARRAWIEMLVAVRLGLTIMSLSARRAWIEISC